MSERRRRYSFDSESGSEDSSEELQTRKGPKSIVNLISTKQCIPRSPSRSPRRSNDSSSSESGSESGKIRTSSDNGSSASSGNGSDEDSASSGTGSGETSAGSDNDDFRDHSHRQKTSASKRQIDVEQKSKPYSEKVHANNDKRKAKMRHGNQDDSSEEEQFEGRHSHEKRNGYEKRRLSREDSDDDRSKLKVTGRDSSGDSGAEESAITSRYSRRESRKRTHLGSDGEEPRSKRERTKSAYDRGESTRSEKDTSYKRDCFADSSENLESRTYKEDRTDSEEAICSGDNRRNSRYENDSRRSDMSRSRKSRYSSDVDSRRDSRRGYSSHSDKRKTRHRKSHDRGDESDAENQKTYSKENNRYRISEKDYNSQRNYSDTERTSSIKKLPEGNRYSPVRNKLDNSDQFHSEVKDSRSGRRSKTSHRDEEDRGSHRKRSGRERRPNSRERRPNSRERRENSRERRENSREKRADSSGYNDMSRHGGSNDKDNGRGGDQRSSDRSYRYEHSRDQYWNRFEERKRRDNVDEDRDRNERKDRPSYQDRSNRRDRGDGNREGDSRPPRKRSAERSTPPRPPRKRSAERSTPPRNTINDVGNNAPNPVIDKESEKYLQAKRSKFQGDESIMTKTGGAYIPPARLRMMQAQITDKASVQYQRIAWEALKKSLNGLINKVNVSNLKFITCEILQENIVRGRGVLARSIIQAQAASPTFTQVYASLVAIINTKFPQIGELILKRVVIQFRKGFRRNDKQMCLSAARFASHLVNQQVAHEILALEILTLLLENPTNDSVEVAVAFLKESGQKLTDVSPRGIVAIFDRLRNVLHEGQLPNRTQYIIEVMFAVRKDGFKDHPAVVQDLDLVEEDDQFTHMLTLEDAVNSEDILNVFKFDPDYEATEEKYKVLKKDILDEGSSDEEDGSGSGSSSESDSDDEGEEGQVKETIIDSTETNLVALRRSIYLTIQSSLDFEECAHKLLKMELKPGQEDELCNMILDCCAQMRTYEKFFGLLAQRFCMLDQKYIGPFQKIFADQYETIHRLETNKLRNVAKFFAHLLYTDAISWEVLALVKLNEDDTTSSSRIFIKILFQELSEYMGLPKLNDRLKDPTLQPYFEGLFPRDTPRNCRFAINFFTSIGQGGLTDELRVHLKQAPKPVEEEQIVEEQSSSSSSSSDSSSGSDSSSSDSSSSDSSSSDSDDSSSSSEEEPPKSSKEKKRKYSKKEDPPESEYSRKQQHDRHNEEISRNSNHVADHVSQRSRHSDRNTRQQDRHEKKDRDRDNYHDRNKSTYERDESKRDRRHRDR